VDFLIGDALRDGLLLAGIAGRVLTASIVVAGAPSALRLRLIRLSVPAQVPDGW
jgi:hypothetical protein